MNKVNKLKSDIFKKVKQYYKIVHDKREEKFIKNKTKVIFAGRVFDEKEMINLVDSALEFWLTSGRFTYEFEKKISEYIGTRYASLVNSGSSANLLAISALTSPILHKNRLLAGDEVITTAVGFPTTISPIIQNQLIPVFVDIDIGTYNVNIEQLKKAVSPKTRAIFLAHTLGNPFNVSAVKKICQENKLWLIEDNCDSLGSRYDGKFTGSFGDLATCSFYPAHHITLGEGGAVLTSNPNLKKILNSLRDWGRECWCNTGKDDTCGKRFDGKFGKLPRGYDHKYVYSHLGYNLKATDLQAAIGVAQINKLPFFVNKRIENHKYLAKGLINLENKIILPIAEKNSQPSWFGFLITLKDNCRITRLELQNLLEKSNIQTRLLFAGNILKQPCFNGLRRGRDYKVVGKLNNTDKVMQKSLWVGVYPGMRKEALDFIIEKFQEIFLK